MLITVVKATLLLFSWYCVYCQAFSLIRHGFRKMDPTKLSNIHRLCIYTQVQVWHRYALIQQCLVIFSFSFTPFLLLPFGVFWCYLHGNHFSDLQALPRWVVYHELVLTTKEYMRQVNQFKLLWTSFLQFCSWACPFPFVCGHVVAKMEFSGDWIEARVVGRDCPSFLPAKRCWRS